MNPSASQDKTQEREAKTNFLGYVILIIISTFLFTMEFRLYRAPLSVPLYYSGDAALSGFEIKTVIDSGWWIFNKYTGGSTGTSMYDFPNADGLSFSISKFIAFFSHDYGFVMNTLFFLGFLLSSLTSFYVLRRSRVHFFISIAISLLFSFLPYHIYRGEAHLFLSEYFMIPLITMAVLDLLLSNESISLDKGRSLIWTMGKVRIPIVAIMVLTGFSGIYYAFFTSIFLFLSFVIISFEKRYFDIRPLFFIGLICLMLLINILPSIVHNISFGSNSFVASRFPSEAEFYGLKIDLLIFPVYKNVLSPLSYFAPKISTQLANENTASYLGLCGVSGFLVLLFSFVAPLKSRFLKSLSILNIFAVLVGTIGGIGAVFAIVVSPNIRAYNRISIFIAFFSLFALAKGLTAIANRIKPPAYRLVMYTLFLLFFSAGLLDQYETSKPYLPDRKLVASEFQSDDNFVKVIEKMASSHDLVFQLPYMSFPENGPVSRMNDYDPFRPYLHSTKLFWSYGAMKGRTADHWISKAAKEDTQSMVDDIGAHGYRGIFLDRNGYEDSALNPEGQLKSILGEPGIQSDSGRYVFYSLHDYVLANGLENVPANDKDNVGVYWRRGFSSIESSKAQKWIWCDSSGDLVILSENKHAISMKLTMGLASGHPELSTLFLSGVVNETIKINSTPLLFAESLNVLPGKNLIHFRTDAKRVDVVGDQRSLYFRVIDPSLE